MGLSIVKKLTSILVALFSLVWLTGAGWLPLAKLTAGGCTQATSFLARTSGLNGAHTIAYTTLICGLVTDGVWTKLDFLHVYGTQDATNALLNLVSSSFSATLVNVPSFTADQGFTGDGSTSYINTGFNPSTAGGNYTQNNASFGMYDRTSTVIVTNSPLMGTYDGTNVSAYYPNGGDNFLYARINSGFDGGAGASINHQGFFMLSRTGATAVAVFKNGSSLYSTATSSTGLPNNSFFTLAANFSGTPTTPLADQVAADFAGGGLNTTDLSNLSSRVNTFFTTFSTNVY
jgi:hypothetical protein